jgi:hypothetical protein
VTYGEVWKGGVEAGRVCDATEEEGNAQKRIGSQRKESEAGDRHRPERGAKRRRQGPIAAAIDIEEAMTTKRGSDKATVQLVFATR